jgi:hypothetical protein
MQADLEEQLALHNDLAVKLDEHHQTAQTEVAALQATLAAHCAGAMTDSRLVGASGCLGADTQLSDAEVAVEELAEEKVQLLEAYQLLEEDTGRLIDEAVSQEQMTKQQLANDLKVRSAGCPAEK